MKNKLICPEIYCGKESMQGKNLKHNVYYFYCSCGFKLLPQNRLDAKVEVTQNELNFYYNKTHKLKIN